MNARCTFEELHMAIQYTFGWFGYHLHEFSVVDQNYKAEEGTPLYAYPKKIRIVLKTTESRQAFDVLPDYSQQYLP